MAQSNFSVGLYPADVVSVMGLVWTSDKGPLCGLDLHDDRAGRVLVHFGGDPAAVAAALRLLADRAEQMAAESATQIEAGQPGTSLPGGGGPAPEDGDGPSDGVNGGRVGAQGTPGQPEPAGGEDGEPTPSPVGDTGRTLPAGMPERRGQP